MDLSYPLACIAPTLDAGVLHVLAATTAGCTAAEVHRRLGRGSDEGVRRVLARLERQGVVIVQRPTRYPVYLLNRQHVAVPHIEAITRVRGELIERIREEIDGWALAPSHAGLFGSFARGTADASSDLDVLLVRPDRLTEESEALWLEQLDRLDALITSWTGNTAQIVDLAQADLRKMADEADPLVDSWRADDIPIYGERLLDLLRRIR